MYTIPEDKATRAAHGSEYPKHWLDGYEQEVRQLNNEIHPGHGKNPIEFYFLWGDLGYEAIAKNSQRYKDLRLTGKLRKMKSFMFGLKSDTSKWAGTRAIFSDGKKEIDSNGNPQVPLFRRYFTMLVAHKISQTAIASVDPNWLNAFW